MSITVKIPEGVTKFEVVLTVKDDKKSDCPFPACPSLDGRKPVAIYGIKGVTTDV